MRGEPARSGAGNHAVRARCGTGNGIERASRGTGNGTEIALCGSGHGTESVQRTRRRTGHGTESARSIASWRKEITGGISSIIKVKHRCSS